MKLPITRIIGAAALGLLMMLTVTTDAMGQGRSRRVFRNSDRKCDKFVNCHDARDGRWDGRGPRRRDDSSLFGIFGRSRRDRDSDRFIRRRSRRDRDRDFDRVERRRVRRNRDFDRGRF
jgi:hypothetical protein